MANEMLPWFTALLVVLATALILLIAAVLLPRLTRTTTAVSRFVCPWTPGRQVTVRVLADDRGRPIHVISCTAFADPMLPTCERECLAEGFQAGAAATESAVSA